MYFYGCNVLELFIFLALTVILNLVKNKYVFHFNVVILVENNFFD